LGSSAPAAWHSISQSPHAHRVRRTGVDSFELEVVDGEMLETPIERLLLSRSRRFAIGQRFELDDFSVSVLELGKRGPRRIAVKCSSALEDPRWLFLVWKDSALQRFDFPGVGEVAEIAWSPGPLTVVL
jgi:hypothetical protein